MRWLPVAFALLLAPLAPARAQISVGIGITAPGVSIGINVPAYPELVAVPGYPVYYAPRLPANYFFYDGLYWVYANDTWYASSWYDGPWDAVDPYYVPAYVLRVPVRYYRAPPPYFRGWRAAAPPRWGHHYGHDWEHRRAGWDRWDRRAVPRPAPLPRYQRGYAGDRYPRAVEQQRSIRSTSYGYRPREDFSRRHDPGPGPGYRGGPAARPHDSQGWSRGEPQPARGPGGPGGRGDGWQRQQPEQRQDRGGWQDRGGQGGRPQERGGAAAPQYDRGGPGRDAGPAPQRGGDRGGDRGPERGGDRGGRGHDRGGPERG
ncbi:hypothetical protein [Anaeromyxobacter dehalogenans]|uniref:Uncharacterized protein n=1 Tax=Anaeromyxobacter dehalogenans (strain 2CP-C) TaxID=290397 RepID=Q2IK27_ANADE|nr:hypothetical protein [Anaeromyxobacter dehalogenans]ABC82004.1 conserved hypothetical protein [Anaeromyxobacter dehalogenans 2CP-C]